VVGPTSAWVRARRGDDPLVAVAREHRTLTPHARRVDPHQPVDPNLAGSAAPVPVPGADVDPLAPRAALLPLVRSPAVTQTSLYDLLAEEAGIFVTRAVERIRPVALAPADARLLGVPARRPAFAVERTSYAGAQVVEWRQSLARGDRYRFVAELRRSELALVASAAGEGG